MAESPRVVVRANVADRAIAEAKLIGHNLKRAGAALRHSPKVVQDAQHAITILAKAHEQNGVLSAEHKKTWQSAMDVLLDAHQVAALEAQDEATRAHGISGRADQMRASMAPSSASFAAVNALVQQMQALRASIQMGQGLGFGPSKWARLMWGPSATPGGWARGGANTAVDRLRAAASLTKGLVLGALLKTVVDAPNVAEQTEARLNAIANRTRLARKDEFSAEENPFFGGKESDLKGMHQMRAALFKLRRGFLATGDELLTLWESAGEGMNANSVVRTGAQGMHLVRSLGITPERAGSYISHMRYHTAAPPERPRVKMALQMMGAVGGGMAAFRRAASNERYLTQDGRQMDLSGAMAYGRMLDRPEMFLGDLEHYSEGLAGGVGVANDRTAMGFAALMARVTGAGGQGGGGEAWRSTGDAVIHGTSSHGSSSVLALKMQAVKHYLGPTTVGADAYRRRLDPNTAWGAMGLIESGDPKVTAALIRFSKARMKRMGGSDNDAKLLFSGLMGGMSARDVEMVWPHERSFRHVEDLTDTAPARDWKSGPMFKGAGGGTERSIGRMKAEVDEAQHYGGRMILDIATNMKEAAVIAAQGFPDDVLGGIEAAIGHLSPEARAVIAMNAVATGHNAVAAGMVAVELSQNVGDKMREKWGVKPPMAAPSRGGQTSADPDEAQRAQLMAWSAAAAAQGDVVRAAEYQMKANALGKDDSPPGPDTIEDDGVRWTPEEQAANTGEILDANPGSGPNPEPVEGESPDGPIDYRDPRVIEFVRARKEAALGVALDSDALISDLDINVYEDEIRRAGLLRRRAPDQAPLARPTPGKVFSHYGPRRAGMHYGVDFAGEVGDPVLAAAAGKVSFIQSREAWERANAKDPKSKKARAGAYVEVTHDDNTVSRYMHLDSIYPGMKVGDTIGARERLGELGRTGIMDDPAHLHFELRAPGEGGNRYGEALDPADYIDGLEH